MPAVGVESIKRLSLHVSDHWSQFFIMRAARFYDKGDIRVEDVEEPKLKDGQV